MSFEDYLQKLGNLRPNRSGGHNSPHKMCLMLAVADLIADGEITENKIELNDALTSRFSFHFDRHARGKDKNDPSQPFFYLESSGFWHHKINEEQEAEYQKRIKERSHGSKGIVKRMIAYAYLDTELFGYFKNPIKRTALEDALLSNIEDYEAENAAVKQDIQTVESDKTLDETEKAILVSARIGQGGFRSGLLEYWQVCALTGFQNPRFLVASHIKPWRSADNRERLDTYNGILLVASLDKAFDLGYITFEHTGKIILSNELEQADKLGIHTQMRINLEAKHQGYLAYHRETVFRK